MREIRPSGLMQGRELSALHAAAISCLLYLVIAGAFIPLFTGRTAVSRLPERRLPVALFGTLAAMATIGAEVGSLFLDMARGEFPWWADSIGIPLSGMPFVFLGLLCWVGFHMWLLPKTIQRNYSGAAVICTKAWLTAMGVFAATYLAYAACIGDFWSLLPMVMWLGFYFSLLKCLITPSIAA